MWLPMTDDRASTVAVGLAQLLGGAASLPPGSPSDNGPGGRPC